MKTESCVFFGSGPVAAASLELLLEHTEVEAVITKPRPPHHRGDVPVLALAESRGLTVYTATDKSSLDDLIAKSQFNSRYAVLIDFGIIVSQKVIDAFKLGIINSHFSLLPQLRGADPISWAIAEGADKTGVSLMLIDTGMDTGKLLAQKTYRLDGSETTPELTESLIRLSDQLIREYLPRYLSGDLKPKRQPRPDRASYSRKLTKADGIIDTSLPASTIERQTRAFQPWPQSRANIGGLDVIVTHAHVSNQPGELGLKCGDGNWLIIDQLKPLGKKEMPARAFLAGYKHKLS